VDPETVEFEGFDAKFRLSRYELEPGRTKVQLVHRGKPSLVTVAPGEPADLAAMLRKRATCPTDVVGLVSGFGLAA
jgi:hypothetical protein